MTNPRKPSQPRFALEPHTLMPRDRSDSYFFYWSMPLTIIALWVFWYPSPTRAPSTSPDAAQSTSIGGTQTSPAPVVEAPEAHKSPNVQPPVDTLESGLGLDLHPSRWPQPHATILFASGVIVLSSLLRWFYRRVMGIA